MNRSPHEPADDRITKNCNKLKSV